MTKQEVIKLLKNIKSLNDLNYLCIKELLKDLGRDLDRAGYTTIELLNSSKNIKSIKEKSQESTEKLDKIKDYLDRHNNSSGA